MSLIGYKSNNHPQQVRKTGAKDHIDDRGTDPALFDKLSKRFGGFSLDVASSHENYKVADFFTRECSGLEYSWYGRVWCNPPYSNIPAWVERAWSQSTNCELIVMLLPANRTEQRWWQSMVEPFRDQNEGFCAEFLPGRPRFVNVGKKGIGPNERPPFGCCLLIWKAV